MKRGEFIINGVHSQELNSLIQRRPAIPSAKRKKRMRQVPGVSGDYIFDEEAYENVPFSLQLFTKGRTEEEVLERKDLITSVFDTGGYVDLILYTEPDNVYEVAVTEEPNYEPDGTTPLLLPYTVGFSARPFKRYSDRTAFESADNLNLVNPTHYTSKPEIKIFGTGDFRLHVNGADFPFQSIDEHVVLDCETENAFKEIPGGITSRNHRMYSMDFPEFEPGENTISISGDATNFIVKPRWVKKL